MGKKLLRDADETIEFGSWVFPQVHMSRSWIPEMWGCCRRWTLWQVGSSGRYLSRCGFDSERNWEIKPFIFIPMLIKCVDNFLPLTSCPNVLLYQISPKEWDVSPILLNQKEHFLLRSWLPCEFCCHLKIFYVLECLACLHACTSVACLVPVEAKNRALGPLEVVERPCEC